MRHMVKIARNRPTRTAQGGGWSRMLRSGSVLVVDEDEAQRLREWLQRHPVAAPDVLIQPLPERAAAAAPDEVVDAPASPDVPAPAPTPRRRSRAAAGGGEA